MIKSIGKHSLSFWSFMIHSPSSLSQSLPHLFKTHLHNLRYPPLLWVGIFLGRDICRVNAVSEELGRVTQSFTSPPPAATTAAAAAAFKSCGTAARPSSGCAPLLLLLLLGTASSKPHTPPHHTMTVSPAAHLWSTMHRSIHISILHTDKSLPLFFFFFSSIGGYFCFFSHDAEQISLKVSKGQNKNTETCCWRETFSIFSVEVNWSRCLPSFVAPY